MGWASAGDIFDNVADGLIEAGANDATKERVLGKLIGSLQDGDWDTEDESLGIYRDDPAIVRAFAAHDVHLYPSAAIDADGIADALSDSDGVYDDGRDGHWSIGAEGNVITGTFTPVDEDSGDPDDDRAVHFRAVVELVPPPAE